MVKGQSTLEALISFTILILFLTIIFAVLSTSYDSEIEYSIYLKAKTELENLALRANFISTSTNVYTKTSLSLPPGIGYSGNELTKDINTKKISAPVLAEMRFIFNDKNYVVNRLDGEPI
ncbi:hypothetical protein KO317_00970 [Candidatus Micrarchaeota archaeon]|jgi:hypothetical protein|nr:hypothetical protein [Candidatus Micrarchaeota archaeon]